MTTTRRVIGKNPVKGRISPVSLIPKTNKGKQKKKSEAPKPNAQFEGMLKSFQAIEDELGPYTKKNHVQYNLAVGKVYIERGIPIFLHRNPKMITGQTPSKNTITDLKALNDQLGPRGKYKSCYLGIPTGMVSGLIVIDVDVKEHKDGTKGVGPKTLEELSDGQHKKTTLHRSPSGGYHYFYRANRPMVSRMGAYPDIDISAENRYVRIYPTPGCSWQKTNDPLNLPDWGYTEKDTSAIDEADNISDALHGNENVGERDVITKHPIRLAFNRQFTIHTILQRNNYTLVRKLRSKRFTHLYMSPFSTSKVPGVKIIGQPDGSGDLVFSWHGNDPLKAEGEEHNRFCWDAFGAWAMLELNLDIRGNDINHKKARMEAEKIITDTSDPLDRIRFLDGKFLKYPTNVSLVMQSEPFVVKFGTLHYDNFLNAVLLDKKEVSDTDVTRMQMYIDLTFSSVIATDMMNNVVNELAKAQEVDCLKDYLSRLPKADPRDQQVFDDLMDQLGVKLDIEKMLFKRWMVSGIARALEPGCDIRLMLILIGLQGAGKSRLFKYLCPAEEWFCESISSKVTAGGDKKSEIEKLAGSWIIELPELTAFRRSHGESSVPEELKQFLTQSRDKYRPAYGRRTETFLRRCIFAGTANDRAFLSDPSGSSRFACVSITRDIDIEWVVEHRDELWSLAKAWYDGGMKHWLNREETIAQQIHNKGFEIDDSWITPVLDWAEDKSRFTIGQVLFDVFDIETSRQQRKDEYRVSNILRTAGYDHRQIRTPKSKRRIKGFINPDVNVDEQFDGVLYDNIHERDEDY